MRRLSFGQASDSGCGRPCAKHRRPPALASMLSADSSPRDQRGPGARHLRHVPRTCRRPAGEKARAATRPWAQRRIPERTTDSYAGRQGAGEAAGGAVTPPTAPLTILRNRRATTDQTAGIAQPFDPTRRAAPAPRQWRTYRSPRALPARSPGRRNTPPSRVHLRIPQHRRLALCAYRNGAHASLYSTAGAGSSVGRAGDF